MLLLHGQAVAGNGKGIGDERLVLLHGLIDGKGGSNVLHHRANADGQAAGSHLAVHHGLDQLLLTALRILLLERKHLDIVGKLTHRLLHGGDGLRLVLLDADHGTASAKNLLHDGSTHHYLLGTLQHDAEVAGEIGLALRAVQDQALSLAAGSGIELHMGGEGSSAESDHAAGLDLVEDGCAVFGDFSDKGVGKIHSLDPLVALHRNLDVSHVVACKILAGADGLHGTGCGRVYERGDESAWLRYHLACLHLVAYGHDGLRRGAKMLGHGNIQSLGQGQHLDGAAAGEFCIVRMHSAYCECYLTHCLSSFLFAMRSLTAALSSSLGKFTPWMAPVGHMASHSRQSLHFAKSI